MRLTVHSLYDSHVHWLGTGEMEQALKLFDLKSEHEVADLKPQPYNFRGAWLVGFGWDQNLWPQGKLPSKVTLDQVFPNFPVMFQRADGHCSWLNSKALAILVIQKRIKAF
ncbi:MAG: hypothetical protein EOP06_13040 [Proteobacteria bacterium]|nr:MAG: hypothetical protein EOP06_13040 [Pseudomonadota bacterium]